MLLSLRQNGLTSLFREVLRVFKVRLQEKKRLNCSLAGDGDVRDRKSRRFAIAIFWCSQLRSGQGTAGGPKWTKMSLLRPRWTKIQFGIRSFWPS